MTRKAWLCTLALLPVIMGACVEGGMRAEAEKENHMSKELIVLAAPSNTDRYYNDVADDIFDFHMAYAKNILKYDDVLVLAGSDFYKDYVSVLGEGHVVPVEMEDIWMRDFSPLNTASPIMMRYSAAGQGGGRRGQKEADAVQEKLAKLVQAAGWGLRESDLINDGGNFVDDYAGNVVLSKKFLRDNKLSEAEAREVIRTATKTANIAFIEADEQGGLEHADGVVAFIEENVLVVNSYPEDPDYAASLRADLERGLPGVTIHEIVTPYDGSDIYDTRFGSACGLYTNMLVTPSRIYFPQFGIPEDSQALASMRRWSDKQIIPVSSQSVCKMGGGVRCMSWQLRGEPAALMLKSLKSR